MSAKRSDHARILARLHTVIALQQAKIRADPIPVLEKAEAQMAKQHHLLLQLHDALVGSDLIFDTAEQFGLHPTNINGEAYIRNQEALKLLSDYFE